MAPPWGPGEEDHSAWEFLLDPELPLMKGPQLGSYPASYRLLSPGPRWEAEANGCSGLRQAYKNRISSCGS